MSSFKQFIIREASSTQEQKNAVAQMRTDLKLTQAEAWKLLAIISGDEGGEIPDAIFDKLYAHYTSANEMPYGTAKARTGDPHEWIADRLEKDYALKESKLAEEKKPVYWISPLGKEDDFDQPYKDEMIDGKTKMGPWANMTPESWKVHGVGKLGLGLGQRYKKQPDGKWLKVEG